MAHTLNELHIVITDVLEPKSTPPDDRLSEYFDLVILELSYWTVEKMSPREKKNMKCTYWEIQKCLDLPAIHQN